MIKYIQSPGLVRTVYSTILKNVLRYSGILMHIHLHLQVSKGNRKTCSDFGKKAMILSILWLNLPFKMQFYEFLGETNSKLAPSGTFIPCAIQEILIEVPQFHKTSPNLEINRCIVTLSHCLFRKTHHRKSLTSLLLRLFLDYCSVTCTVTLRYMLHQSQLEF